MLTPINTPYDLTIRQNYKWHTFPLHYAIKQLESKKDTSSDHLDQININFFTKLHFKI